MTALTIQEAAGIGQGQIPLGPVGLLPGVDVITQSVKCHSSILYTIVTNVSGRDTSLVLNVAVDRIVERGWDGLAEVTA